MFKQIVIIASIASTSVVSVAASGVGFVQSKECVMVANQGLQDYGYGGFDVDGVALYFDNDGKTTILDQNKIVSRKTENGEETITYKTKKIKAGSFEKVEFESVNRTIVIKRDSTGEMIGFTKVFDIKEQVENIKAMKKQFNDNLVGAKIIKSVNNEFINSDDDCYLNQTVTLEMKDEKSKEEKSVSFDKKFCDSLAPIINNMGKQNAAQCGNLIASAQMNFNTRRETLAKEDKNLKLNTHYFGYGQATTGDSAGNVFSISAAIQSCLPMQSGFGMQGYPGGYGYGMGGGGIFKGSESKKADTKKSKSSN